MKKIWILVVAVAAVGTVAALALLGGGREWSSSSDEAVREFLQGLDAEMKVYHDEARIHFAKAVSLDPQFSAAKAMLALELMVGRDADGTKELVADLRKADLSGLTPRERFLVRLRLAEFDGDRAESGRLIDEFLASHPDDPWALYYAAGRAMAEENYDRAGELYRRLIKIAPNWVTAYNQLGYMEMRRGNWAEAERMFDTYKFIAPDHANPHDSLGELLALTGRYGEAEREFEEAIAVKLDFCASYQHLVTLALLQGRSDKIDAALFRASESGACPAEVIENERCNAAIGQAARNGDWSAVLELRDRCKHSNRGAYWLVFRAALLTGDTGRANELETRIRERVKEKGAAASAEKSSSDSYYRAWLLHMEGTRAAVEGRLSDAVRDYREADALIPTAQLDVGVEKMFNLACLAEVLRLDGQEQEAERVRRRIDDINPTIVDSFGRSLEVQRQP